MSNELIAREFAHYQEHKRYLLHFLERDRTECGRWLIRATLATWDRQLAFLNPAWIRGRRVLEVGCGNPRVTQYFRHLGAAHAVGNDLSQAFAARGLRRSHNYAFDAVFPAPADTEIIYGDFTGSAVQDLTFDTVACFQSLHHIHLEGFVAACERVLRPGGHVLISDPVGDHPLRRLANAVGRASGLLSPDEKARCAQEVIDAFRGRGFDLVETRSLNPTLEIYFQLTELVTPLSPRLAFWLKTPMAWWRPVENWLEQRVLPRHPRWGWRYYLVFRKAGDNNE
ncbi:MAG: class I SAM-dependent methyltransferase [Candidatus Lernaella stagnicola]|nr:class I SAM-dependent methyltransferase [Candidatus Lernaella stagnicola]